LLLNHKVTGDGIWNSRGFVKPDKNQEHAEKLLGPFPKAAKPSFKGNRWAVRAILENAGKETPPNAMILWLTDPDGVAHQHGVGSPETVEAIRHIDGEIGFLLDGLNARGLKDKINILVSTDHGFSTYTGGFNLRKLLSARGLDNGVIVVDGQIYVKDRDAEKIKAIVRALQEFDWAGAIFTRAKKPGSAAGFVPGTLSFDLIHWNHERAADILVDANWSDATNTFGYRGTTAGNGTAGHGTSSPFDLNIRLIASGPAFKRALRSDVPTGNIDLAPTILHLLGIQPPRSMDGRILQELLRNGPSPKKVVVKEIVERVAARHGTKTYELELKKLIVGNTDYIDFTKVNRK
jgi:arylsulfatase A-like enzyme